MKEESTLQTYYKGVILLPNGEMLSPWAGGVLEESSPGYPWNDNPELTYKEGEITKSPTKYGITVYKEVSLDSFHVTKNKVEAWRAGGGVLAIISVLGIGDFRKHDYTFNQGTFKAVFVTGIVEHEPYPEPEPEPEPKPVWEDVTDECTVKAARDGDGMGVRIHHDHYIVARLCVGEREHEMVGGIGSWEYELITTNGSWFRVFRRPRK